MIGMDLLKLRRALENHRWTPSRGHEEIDEARRKEDYLLTAVAVIFFVAIFAAVLLSLLG